MKPYEKLQRYWRETAAGMETIESSCSQVAALENRYGIRLPEDFRDYLLHSCPKDEFSNCDLDTFWWSFDRIKNIPEEYEHPISDAVIARDAAKYIFFADYAIWCWAWAICCGDDENRGRVALIGGMPDQFVANSFAAFIDIYIEDSGGNRRLCTS